MDKFNNLDFYSDISFVPCTLDEILQNMIFDYEAEYQRHTGQVKKVPQSSPEYVMLTTQAYRIYQVYEKIDFAAKQNFIKYASGAYLENLGAMVMVTRLKPKAAVTKVEFILSAAVGEIVTIKAGTRISPGDNIFFATTEDCYVPVGSTTAQAIVTCSTVGDIGNGYKVGSINILVDPVNYVKQAINIETSQGGADIEADDNLRMRIYMKPDSFSVAGPAKAYEYFAYEFSQNIIDCNVVTPVPGQVIIVIVLQSGEIPQTAFLDELAEFLEEKRPMTDKLEVIPPVAIEYDIKMSYYISNSNQNAAELIRKKSEQAVTDFIAWQKSRLGRDINPNELTRRLMDCGVKRVEVESPVHTQIEYNQLGVAKNVAINFGGFEDE